MGSYRCLNIFDSERSEGIGLAWENKWNVKLISRNPMELTNGKISHAFRLYKRRFYTGIRCTVSSVYLEGKEWGGGGPQEHHLLSPPLRGMVTGINSI